MLKGGNDDPGIDSKPLCAAVSDSCPTAFEIPPAEHPRAIPGSGHENGE